MQRTAAFLLVLVSSVRGLLIGSSAGSYAVADQKHPIKNIIVMLRQQTVKIDEEGRTEQKTYNKFKAWCKTEIEKLTGSIEDDRALVSKTKNMVVGKDSEHEELERQISVLDTEISQQQGSLKSANDERAEAKALFDQTENDLNMSLKALDDAIAGLKASEANATAANDAEVANSKLTSLMQIPLVLEQLTDEQETELEAALRREGTSTTPSFKDWEKKRKFGPSKDMLDTRDYSFKSGNIVKLLGQLKTDFSSQLKDTRKTEAAAVREHSILAEDLNSAIAASEASKKEKVAVFTEVASKLAELKDTRDQTAERKDDNSKLLGETKASCKNKASEWSKRKEFRYGEMQAIKKAIYLLGKAAGVQTEKPENKDAAGDTKVNAGLLSTGARTSFAAGSSNPTDPRSVVVRLLREQALTGRADSAALEAMASKVERESGPSDERVIKNMLLIFQKQVWGLERDQERDSKKEMWCDEQLTANKKSFNETTQQLESMNASILEKEASIQEFAQEITAAQEEVDSLSTSMAEATEVRQENKAENEVAIRDAKTAQEASQKALEVLSEFYGASQNEAEAGDGEIGTASDTSLIQKASAAPATWDSSYSGIADPNAKGGVISIMQTILADFSQMEVETKAQEVADQSEYDKEMAASRKSQAKARTEAQLKMEEKQRYETELRELARSLAITDRELASVKNYLSELNISCDMAAFAQRKKERTAEIEDMETAMKTVKAAFGASSGAESSFLGLN